MAALASPVPILAPDKDTEAYRHLVATACSYHTALKNISRRAKRSDLDGVQDSLKEAEKFRASHDNLVSLFGFSEQQVRAAEDAAKTLTRG
jgi:hypothetical protein